MRIHEVPGTPGPVVLGIVGRDERAVQTVGHRVKAFVHHVLSGPERVSGIRAGGFVIIERSRPSQVLPLVVAA